MPTKLATTEKKAWRYVVTEVSAGFTSVRPGQFVLDWKYLGKTYTWQVFDAKAGAVTGWWTGKFVDEGVLRDGEYVATT